MKRIVIISAHPDDELLGAGGTLLKHAANGDTICWIIATNISEQQGYSKEQVVKRQQEIADAAKAFGVSRTEKLDFPTMSLNGSMVGQIISRISAIFMDFKPEIIYTINRSDAHSDHRYLSDAVMACTKSFRYPFIKQVLMYECISETEQAPAFPEKMFIPNYFVDISAYMQKKLELISIYESEFGDHPFPRSAENIKALATFRGATVGVQYAEAFQLVKYIDK